MYVWHYMPPKVPGGPNAQATLLAVCRQKDQDSVLELIIIIAPPPPPPRLFEHLHLLLTSTRVNSQNNCGHKIFLAIPLTFSASIADAKKYVTF